MMTAAEMREHAQNVERVFGHICRLRLSPDDLTGYDGEDLRSRDPARSGKARCVEKTWALMARLGVKHIDLETAISRGVAPTIPGGAPSRRRGRRSIKKRPQNQELVKSAPSENPIEIIEEFASQRISEPAREFIATNADGGTR
jgi:hypothetical protein